MTTFNYELTDSEVKAILNTANGREATAQNVLAAMHEALPNHPQADSFQVEFGDDGGDFVYYTIAGNNTDILVGVDGLARHWAASINNGPAMYPDMPEVAENVVSFGYTLDDDQTQAVINAYPQNGASAVRLATIMQAVLADHVDAASFRVHFVESNAQYTYYRIADNAEVLISYHDGDALVSARVDGDDPIYA